MIEFVSAIAMLVFSIVCFVAIFSRQYRDNWLQFIGLCGCAVWGVARTIHILGGGAVSEMQAIAHVSLAMFAVGTALKVVKAGDKNESFMSAVKEKQ